MQAILELCFLIVNKFPFTWTGTPSPEGHKRSPADRRTGKAVPDHCSLGEP